MITSSSVKLKEECMSHLVKNIQQLPPLIFEDIVGKTRENITSVSVDKNMERLSDILPQLVTDIISDMSKGESSHLLDTYVHYDVKIVRLAQNIAEKILIYFTFRYEDNPFHTSFYSL